MENGAKSYLCCGGFGQEVSDEKNINMRHKDCSCDILVKNVVDFALV